jgi:hypothetical protein
MGLVVNDDPAVTQLQCQVDLASLIPTVRQMAVVGQLAVQPDSWASAAAKLRQRP